MRKVCLGLLLCCFLILPVSGEMAAPPVPEAGERLMPAQNQSFSQGLRQIAGELLPLLRPELARGLASGAGLVALCLLLALFPAGRHCRSGRGRGHSRAAHGKCPQHDSHGGGDGDGNERI